MKSYYTNIKDNLESVSNYFSLESLNIDIFDLLTKFKSIIFEKDSLYTYIEFLKDSKDLNEDIKQLIYSDEDLTEFSSKFVASFNLLYLEEYINVNNSFDMYTNASFMKFCDDFVSFK